MGNVFFTADMHFSHGGSIRTFKRPFSSTQEMDETIISRWNSVVRMIDWVVVLGDLTIHTQTIKVNILPLFQRLNGRKCLVRGNHDWGPTLELPWVWAKQQGMLKGMNEAGIWLRHCPEKVWPGRNSGAWHLFGHRHGTYEPRGLSLDVGMDCWNFTPVEFSEVRMRMENLEFGGASMGNRRKVDKQKFIQDIRAGLTGEDLRSKYEMTPTAFQNLLSQLLEQGRITNDDLRRTDDATSNSANSHALSLHPEAGVHRLKKSRYGGREDSPQVPAERLVVVDDFLRDPLLRLIEVVDQCNHAVKQGDWHQSDLDTFYQMKDAFMEKLYRNPPMGMEVALKLVPYLRRCIKCKHQAGSAMRTEGNAQNFEHYLQRIPPCGNDYEDAERATLEMEVRYMGRVFCFHIPVQQAQDWGVDMTALDRKEFIPAKEFNHMKFAAIFEEIRALLALLP